jgi:hypothetical protein
LGSLATATLIALLSSTAPLETPEALAVAAAGGFFLGASRRARSQAD